MKSDNHCRVTADYEPAYPDPIIMAQGEELQVGKRDLDNEAWIWCTGQSGKSGWVPVRYIEQHGDRAIALRDYAATELSVRAGEELVVSNEENGWLWCTNGLGESGWVLIENVDWKKR